MNQNIIIPIVTILFYISSMLGGNGSPEQYESHNNIDISQPTGHQAEIIGDKVMVRTGPGTNHSPFTSLNKGDNVILIDVEDGWFQISTQDGRTGWIAGYLASIIPEEIAKTKNHDKTVLGFYILGSQSYDSLIINSNSLTGIAPWSWGLSSYGSLTADFDNNEMAKALQFAGNQQLETYALIHNLFQGSFDSNIISTMLNNKLACDLAIEEISTTLQQWEMSGINLDLENVPAKDRNALTEFVKQLSNELRANGLKVTMAVPAKTNDDPANTWSAAYDYAKLGEYVDQLIIMAYDQHYRSGPAGPIASVQWIEEVIQYTLSQVPAAKVVLGIPNYGYDWPKAGIAEGLTYNQTMRLAASEGANIQWHSDHKVPYFSYGNEHEVWFENKYSIRYKLELADEYNLQGIALWRLGQEDPGIWQVINDAF